MVATLQKTDLVNLFDDTATAPERLAKRMAGAGLCSRREAETWINAGRVKVDGQLQLTPAITVTGDQRIEVDGKPLPMIDTPRLWRYYKPRGLVVSHKDEKERDNIFDTLKQQYGDNLPRLISVGRLDLDSEGLILLTNNGLLARYLELPATGWTRKYRVRVHGQVKAEHLKELGRGITVDGVKYRPVIASLDRQTNSNAWVDIALKEGKNREIRRLMEHFGYQVSRLIRTSFGPFTLNKLEDGDIAEVRPAILRDQLGLKPDRASDDSAATPQQARKRQKPHASHQRQKTRRNPNRT
ncbi:MAG: rRNA pseudouridine synthase [Alphaproteobacteria bacterium]|nr:rRNA pseudouridine synthase [Alphaproteobacteria bacterium]MDG2466519.1 pseudouridine synthase [Alphaproteobacteria bacterium]